MRTLTLLLRNQGTAPTPARAPGPPEELPIEEWIGMEEEQDPMAEILEAIRGDVERVVDQLKRKAGSR